MSVLKRYNGTAFETVGLPEAPSDSKQYARKNGSWEEVSHQSLSAYRTASAQDVIDGGKESASNKVTALSSASTDSQYPSAKCVYDMVGNIETLLSQI